MADDSKCPFAGGSHGRANRDWWPNQLNLQILNQHSDRFNPMGQAFDYAKEFKTLDLNAVMFAGFSRPKKVRAALYTAGSISTIVVEMLCRMKAEAEMPAPSPLW